MKKRDLYSFLRGLKMCNFEHPRVTYAVNKNKRLVRQIIEDMEKAVEPDEKMKAFMKEREDLAKLHCAKDEAGNPVIKRIPGAEPGEFQAIYDIVGQNDEKSKYGKELAKLEAKYKDDIKNHEEKVRKYNEEFLGDESEYEPFMVDLDFFEYHEKCPQNLMDLIFWMIREPVEPVELKKVK